MTDKPTSVMTALCPFCGEDSFDLIGLKGHLTQQDCDEYRNIVPPPRETAQ